MIFRSSKRVPLKTVLSVAALLALAGLSARGQAPSPASERNSSFGTPVSYGANSGQIPSAYPSGAVNPGSPQMCLPKAGPSSATPQAPFQPYFLPPHPCMPAPYAPTPGQPGSPGSPGQTTPPSETTPRQPGDTTTPPDQSQTQPQNQNQNQNQNQGSNFPDLSSEQGAASGGDNVALAAPGGYLDNPIPITTFRLRFDAAYGQNRPDRAEYFYGAWQELGFHPHGIQGKGVFFDPKAVGPNLLPSNVNYQEPSAYLEVAAPNHRFSGFIDVPYRLINFRNLQEDNPESEQKRNKADSPAPGSPFFPEPDSGTADALPKTNYNGFSDIQFGFKGAIIASPNQFLTAQLRVYTPSGNSFQGLGTGHWSLEPSLLYYKRINRLVLQGQLTDWIPIDGGEAGNIISYGAGLGYALYQRGNFAIMPISEFLGWTVLNGYEAVFQPITATAPPGLELPLTHGVKDASGDTIVNGKFGVRVFFGEGQSLYFGYGRALTGTHWYTDDFRVEYRIFFGPNRSISRPL